jgi:hypothetical protein
VATAEQEPVVQAEQEGSEEGSGRSKQHSSRLAGPRLAQVVPTGVEGAHPGAPGALFWQQAGRYSSATVEQSPLASQAQQALRSVEGSLLAQQASRALGLCLREGWWERDRGGVRARERGVGAQGWRAAGRAIGLACRYSRLLASLTPCA